MTNKEAINNLNFIMDYYKDLDDYTINQLRNLTLSLSSDEIEALDKAIASLEAWDKVIAKLDEKIDEQYVDKYDFCYQQGIEFALELIKKYKKEIEE